MKRTTVSHFITWGGQLREYAPNRSPYNRRKPEPMPLDSARNFATIPGKMNEEGNRRKPWIYAIQRREYRIIWADETPAWRCGNIPTSKLASDS